MEPEAYYCFHKARHLALSWTTSIQTMPLHQTFWRSILISSSHLRVVLSSGLLGWYITLFHDLFSERDFQFIALILKFDDV